MGVVEHGAEGKGASIRALVQSPTLHVVGRGATQM